MICENVDAQLEYEIGDGEAAPICCDCGNSYFYDWELLCWVHSKQEEIDDATRDAYLYAIGMIAIVLSVTFAHAWAFYLAQNTGMQMRIITMGAIYHKVTQCTIMYAIIRRRNNLL